MAKNVDRNASEPPDWTWLARIRRLLGPLWRVVAWSMRGWLHRAITAALLAAVLGGVLWWRVSSRGTLTGLGEAPTLQRALDALEAGRFEEARTIAAELRNRGGLSYHEQSGPLYVLGTVLAHDAAEQWNEERRRTLYLLAARYLEEAAERGLPKSQQADASFLLGQCLYLSGRYDDAIPVLKEAWSLNPSRRARIHLLLANSYYHAATPELDKALEHGLAFVRHPDAEARQKEETWLQLANIYLRNGDPAAAQQALTHIPPQSKLAPMAELYRIRLAILATDKAADSARGANVTPLMRAYQKAIDDLRRLKASQPPSGEVARGASYLIGVCYRQRGKRLAEAGMKLEAEREYASALDKFFRTQKLFYRYAEGIVAALEEPELLQYLGRYADAGEAYDRLISEVQGFEPYDNPWLSQDELRNRLRAAHQRFLDAHAYEQAVRFARQLPQVLPENEATLLLARSLRGWAEHLEGESREEPWFDAEQMQQLAREKWREAAVAFRHLSELRFATRAYPEDLWQCAYCFLKGRNYRQAVSRMEIYLKSESRSQRARGMLGLGEAHLALGHTDQAIKTLSELIQFYPTHPISYQARIVAARALTLKGEWQAAQQMLETNLVQEALTPRSREWRDSLFELGEILFRRGMHYDIHSRLKGQKLEDAADRRERTKNLERAHHYFTAAAEKLHEAVRRYPDAPQLVLARYRLAESHRRGTRYLLDRYRSETIEADRAVWRRQIRKLLESAIAEYEILEEMLNLRQEAQTLDRTEALILRNSYFAHADSLFDLGRYREAIKAYSSVSNRYQNEPVSLEAFVQIASCYHRLGRNEDARGTMEQAKVVLSRIPPEADFLATTRYDRAQWNELLDWLSSL